MRVNGAAKSFLSSESFVYFVVLQFDRSEKMSGEANFARANLSTWRRNDDDVVGHLTPRRNKAFLSRGMRTNLANPMPQPPSRRPRAFLLGSAVPS